MKSQHIQSLSRFFRVLSDQTRLKLVVLLLQKGEQHVTQLCKTLRLPQPTVSHHLGLLRAHGLVRNRRQGKQVFYSIDPVPFRRAGAAVKQLFGLI
ncbi:MAG: hypothetical protein B1H04_00025 [Planctomycetales bacterium 4484_123]|nr:MAG: hypothetical protein B1H04_00025 [Planctomycetales bacterium 4484_123]